MIETPLRYENGLLASLPKNELDAIARDLHVAEFALAEVVYEAEDALEHVYFPTSALLSVLTVMKDGAAIEIGTVGREGMIGIEAMLGARRVPEKAIAQVPGMTYCMRIAPFREHLARCDRFRNGVERYGRTLYRWLAQTIACNRLHYVNERCAKWLLTTHDKVGSDTFPMTQEFLSTMLGVNRPSVTLAAAALQNAGFIRYSRGSMTITNRSGLEAAACECYARLGTEFLELLRPV